MRKLTEWSRLAAIVALLGTGCKSLEVVNPNAPDAARAFSDPGAVQGLVTGAVRSWVQLRTNYDGALVASAMADEYSASWNNFNLRYYTSYGVECPNRCGWANTNSSPFRFQVETFWYGFYSLLSSVNDVLKAIRTNGVILTDQATTDMHEATAVMMQGVVFANISLNYDQGFVVTEGTDLSDPSTLPLLPRAEMRDSAIAKFEQAIALMTAHPFSASPSTWLGAPGPQYSSAQLIKLMRTMQAEALAYHARNAAEDATTNWAQVATYASNGISSGTPVTFSYADDNVNMNDGLLEWGNAIFTMRADTRLAHVITNGPDPAKIHHTPWPGTADPPPNAFDKRVGDGTWGPSNNFSGAGSIGPATANAGSDFAYMALNFLNPARGTLHFSNLMHIRYSYAASVGSGLPGEDGTGVVPAYIPAQNDLLWAEGLVRSGGNTGIAAGKINNTRVTRGHLSTLTGGEGTAALLAAIRYENDIELLGTGPSPMYNRRRETPEGWTLTQTCPGNICLWPDTPRQMPIPAKELSVLKKELYSFGGPGVPDLSPSAVVAGENIWSARQIGEALRKHELQEARARHRY